ncbi:MAG TPA: sigma-70 family RNA polymerase sigma factor [Gammaproteobacteria bacterium]|jgi:RNA polymerase sigma factor (sigma-70 family)
MKRPPGAGPQAEERNRRLTDDVVRESPRLRSFIRRRVADEADVEDILQEVFSELFEAYRLLQPIGQVGAWLFRVAKNRITDRYRKRGTEGPRGRPTALEDDDDLVDLMDLLPSPDAGPEAAYVREGLLEELDAALDELPEEQQSVFVAHELEGRSFKELSAETGVSVNTLLARKHYAVRHLRRRLQDIYDDITGS